MKFTADEAGRADKLLAKHYPDAGRRQLGELFDAGEVKLRGNKARKGDMCAAGDVLELLREPVSGEALRPLPDPSIELEILVERPDFLVLNKPAGVPTQPLKAGELGTIANALAARFPECATIGTDPRDGGLVHRLDIGTSGLLVAARSAEAYRTLRDAFGKGGISKEYLAITDGTPVSREMDAPLAQRGTHVAIDHTDGLEAHTMFQPQKANGEYALIRCIATTGRMHQVRAHLAFANAPLTGDVLYKGKPLEGHPGFFLHAHKMQLALSDGTTLELVAPLPARFTAALAACGIS
ncbi:RluA family pseudouridine synthase [soil metagenome]